MVATGFAQLWQAKQEAARLKKEEESASFKFRERTVEMKSEEELDEQVSLSHALSLPFSLAFFLAVSLSLSLLGAFDSVPVRSGACISASLNVVIPQDFAATFVDFAADFADLEVRREGDNSDNVELDQVLSMSRSTQSPPLSSMFHKTVTQDSQLDI